MNANDLVSTIEAHAATHPGEPIFLGDDVWHAAKQTYLLAFGEGTMFPSLAYPESFMCRGVALVYDREGRAGESDAAKAIADLALVPGPRITAPAMHAASPHAQIREGQPRPELDGQVAVEHFADESGVFTAPAPVEGDRTVDPVEAEEVPEGERAPTPESVEGEAHEVEHPEGDGFKAMSQKADAEHGA